MSTARGVERRLERRELHGSRSPAAVLVLIVIGLAAAWLAIECALVLMDRTAMLARPGAVVDEGVSVVDRHPALAVAIAALMVIVGVALLAHGLTPGRRSRHSMRNERMLVVADDAVLASALAHRARTAARLGPDRARAWVSRRRAQVRLTPTAGVALPQEAVQRDLSAFVADLALDPPVAVTVTRAAEERVA